MPAMAVLLYDHVGQCTSSMSQRTLGTQDLDAGHEVDAADQTEDYPKSDSDFRIMLQQRFDSTAASTPVGAGASDGGHAQTKAGEVEVLSDEYESEDESQSDESGESELSEDDVPAGEFEARPDIIANSSARIAPPATVSVPPPAQGTGETAEDDDDDSDDSQESSSSEEQVVNGHKAGKVVATDERVKTICARLLRQDVVAVDIEGVGLGRTGEICIVQVADRQGHVYLFDVTTLGKSVFTSGLKALLESESVAKLFFDCRADTDALWHLHKVLPKNLLDMQVLVHKAVCGSSAYVLGLGKALEYILPYQKRQGSKGLKEAGQRLFAPNLGGKLEIWRQRPLPMILRCYCAVDVVYLFDMLKQWNKHMSISVLRKISEGRMNKHIRSEKPTEGVARRYKDFSLPKDVTAVMSAGRNLQAPGTRPPGVAATMVSAKAGSSQAGRVLAARVAPSGPPASTAGLARTAQEPPAKRLRPTLPMDGVSPNRAEMRPQQRPQQDLSKFN